jgi:hypothetical protein
MKDERLHNLYLHFQELPISRRILYTGTLLVLGLGYLFGLLYLYESDNNRDGEPGLSVQDIVVAYSGSRDGTVLESALRGPMSTMLDPTDMSTVFAWLREGSDELTYDAIIKPILDENCLACHDGSNPHLDNLDGYENVAEVTRQDTGADIFTLVRVSHIHLFGMTFIFFLMGLIFSHSYLRPIWFKCVIMAAPFVCVVFDISSWYFTKLFSGFAYVVMFSGATMAFSFAVMWFTSMYQMWFYKLPPGLKNRAIQDPSPIG